MSQKLISELNEVLLKKSSVISVTKVVHRLTLPFAISPAIVELSTAVYVTPLITSVSPTVACGHLQVLFSKYILSELELVLSGQVPHMGLLSSVRAEEVEKLFGSDVILETHQLVKSWLNAEASLNIYRIVETLEVSQLEISPLNDEAPENKAYIIVKLEVSQLPMS